MSNLNNLKINLVEKWKNFKKKFNHEMLIESLDQFEKQCVDQFIITYSSFEDYHVRNSPPPRSRVIKAWLMIVIALLIEIIFVILAYTDDPKLFELFGVPLIVIGRRREIIIILLLSLTMVMYIKTIILILERKKNLEIINIISSIKKEWRGELIRKNALMLTVLFKLTRKFIYPLCVYSCILFFSLLYLKFSLDPDNYVSNQFPYTYVVGFFFYMYSAWVFYNITYCGVIIYLFSTIYIILRFIQVRDRIAKSKSNLMILYCLRDHNQICCINQRNNRLLSPSMFMIYFVLSIIFDILIYTVINMKNFALRILFTFFSIIVSFLLFLMSIFSAYLSTSAHAPYKRLNTYIITRSLTYSNKFNILNLIERLGGPDIATYCGDLFPINMFTFYLLVANVLKNFLIILDLFSVKSNKI